MYIATLLLLQKKMEDNKYCKNKCYEMLKMHYKKFRLDSDIDGNYLKFLKEDLEAHTECDKYYPWLKYSRPFIIEKIEKPEIAEKIVSGLMTDRTKIANELSEHMHFFPTIYLTEFQKHPLLHLAVMAISFNMAYEVVWRLNILRMHRKFRTNVKA